MCTASLTESMALTAPCLVTGMAPDRFESMPSRILEGRKTWVGRGISNQCSTSVSRVGGKKRRRKKENPRLDGQACSITVLFCRSGKQHLRMSLNTAVISL